ncbi:MAG: tRNA lysidine(34) synthetase TilS [Ignavibacteriales bacterium]|nr:tRNA lysidine(34) synthetase TilS [Ignavibacteriales bacterium]
MQKTPLLLKKVKQFSEANGLIPYGAHVGIAVSGGVDSMTLMDVLISLRKEWNLTLSVLHVNHSLRGAASVKDEEFVRRRCAAVGVPVFAIVCPTTKLAQKQKLSIQVAARNARYSFFEECRKKIHADVVATAHTADDAAETVLLNLFRGTGIDGLAGIPLRRKDQPVVRPLLCATRKEILAYARARRLLHREDATNATDKYARNFIRHRILPAAEHIQPAVVEHIAQTASIVRSFVQVLDDVVNKAARKIVEKDHKGVALDVAGLYRVPEYVKQMVVHRTLVELGIEPTVKRMDAVLHLAGAQTGASFRCGGWCADREEKRIVFRKTRRNRSRSRVLLPENGRVTFGGMSIAAHIEKDVPKRFGGDGRVEYIDGGAIEFPLTVRSWKKGDRFRPLGMAGEKKVSDFFVDQKIARSGKADIPVVVSGGNIIWIAGHRIDDRVKITNQTRSAVRLSMERALTIKKPEDR